MSRRSKGKNRNRWKMLGDGASQSDKTIVSDASVTTESEPSVADEGSAPSELTIVATPDIEEVSPASSESTIVVTPAAGQETSPADSPTMVLAVEAREVSAGTEILLAEKNPPAPVSIVDPAMDPETSSSSTDILATREPRDAWEPIGLARDLIDAGLLDEVTARRLGEAARRGGKTFFRCLSEETATNIAAPVFRHISAKRGWKLIESEAELMSLARAQPWLRYSRASAIGAVALVGGEESEDVALVDPFDIPLRDWLGRDEHLGPDFVSTMVLPNAFESAVQRLKNRPDEEEGEENVLFIDISATEEQRISASIQIQDVPVLVDYFLQRGYLDAASDIHIEPTEEFLLIRNRVDGILHEDNSLPIDRHAEIVSRIKILSGMDVAEKRRPQDGRIGTSIRQNAIDVRVSTFPTIHGEKLVMRLLDRNALRPSPEDLGMLPRDLRLLYEKLDAPFGLVMISGPTGSRKTTTLYSCLGRIDKTRKNVLTVEDPVEYRLKGVHQMQVNDRIGVTFESGLRTILRQDPDVIMVGECRDQETAGMAIQAALTGHIVFSTIHTNDAIGVITRLLDMGIDSFLVANALTLAIAQRLVRKICDQCRGAKRGDEILARLASEGITVERLVSLGIHVETEEEYQCGTGCPHCRNTGYQGRQAVFEVFEMTNTARAMIMAPDFNADTLRAYSREQRMTTLIHHGERMIANGITTHEEVIRVLGESY
jgi:type IV pilus assembly protein PilB